MMRSFAALLFSLLAFSPFAAVAANPVVDLGLKPNDLTYNKQPPFVVGDTVRIYARIHNLGETDVQGFAAFFQGTVPIGQTQVISVRAGSTPEEVFVDFVVPSGPFNIRADIKGTDPQDTNPANDSTITKLVTPILDDDRDTIENEKDNCPLIVNKDQVDTDGDGLGNACDDDDDNEGVTDAVERELGTNPLVKDTDGDGFDDAHDAYPLDGKRHIVPPPPPPPPAPTPVPAPKPVAAAKETAVKTAPPKELAAVIAQAAQAVSTATKEDIPPSVPAPTAQATALSPQAVFRLERQQWNTFLFTALTPEVPGYRFAWDFGDGVTSNRREVSHAYAASREYTVTLAVTDPDGGVSKDTAVVRVPFFTLHNGSVLFLVVLLMILLAAGLGILWRLSHPAPRRFAEGEEDETHQVLVHDDE